MPNYRSVVASWDTKSAVRCKPRRVLAERDDDRVFFSLNLSPTASHPMVIGRGKEQPKELLVRRLYSYLDFTTLLEQEIVNPVVLRLSRDAFGLDIPRDMKFDAYRIYCDEAYHALFSVDIKQQVENCTGIASPPPLRPRFARVIRDIKMSLPSKLFGLVEFCATVVSETLISGSLTQLPTDHNVVTSIREAIADHAADERTHHAYFTRAFEIAWPQLDADVQRQLSPYFADFILAFLAPDYNAERVSLELMGFKSLEADMIVQESHPSEEVIGDIRHAARSTIRLLQRTGVLNDNGITEHFVQMGILAQE